MKVQADRNVCVGAGMCALTAPRVFDQDADDGRVQLLDPTPPPEEQPAVREAAELCPSGAISLLE